MTPCRRDFLKAAALAGMTSSHLLAAGAEAGAASQRGAVRQANPGEPAMRTILNEGFGRIVILSFDRGEKLREGIRDAHGIPLLHEKK